jgi:hypothetical protein
MPFPTNAEDCLHVLKHYKSFNHYLSDLSDPYGRAISTFQIFTNSIIAGIERTDPNVLCLIDDYTLSDIYTGLPTFSPEVLKPWVKDAMLKHPLRRTPKQYHFLAIARVQNRGDLKTPRDIAAGAQIELDDWKARLYDPANLLKDPDALYFFRNKNGIKDIDPAQDKQNFSHECLICSNLFDKDAHQTQRAPCGHVVCRECFGKWLTECKGTYSCPLCRACVVCGVNDCPHHDVHQVRATPRPLSKILDLVLPEKVGEVLHGIKPERYWALREITRRDRVMLAWIDEVLGVVGRWDPVRVREGRRGDHGAGGGRGARCCWGGVRGRIWGAKRKSRPRGWQVGCSKLDRSWVPKPRTLLRL